MTEPQYAVSTRVGWHELPAVVRSELERVAGAPVLAASTIRSGFSPGLLARLDLSNGSQVFAKLCKPSINPRTLNMHDRESAVMASFDASVPSVQLVGPVAADSWSGIVTVYFDGVQPGDTEESVRSALALADVIGESVVPAGLERHGDLLADDFLWFGLRRLIERDGSLPTAWADRSAERLMQFERGLLQAIDGTQLIHGDLRADNVLVKRNGTAVAVDWPAAAVGNELFDLLTLVASLACVTGQPAMALQPFAARIETAEREVVDTILVGLYGHYLWASTLGHPPGIPGVRAYQAQLAAVLEAWLTIRL